MKTKGYEKRFYRDWVKKAGLNFTEVIIEETDVLISIDKELDFELTKGLVKKYRQQIKDYIIKDKNFLTSLKPIEVSEDAPLIVKDMAKAARIVGVGPMAAVAGAIAEYLGRGLDKDSKDIIVENGGDIFIKTSKPRRIGIYAGDSVLSGKVSIEIEPKQTPCGVCCSSGTVGHSLSFGKADAAVIVADSVILADALATEVGNRVKSKSDLGAAIDFGNKFKGVRGILIIIGENLSVWGKIKIVK